MAKDITPDYAVPALEKALDILELLAARQEGLTQNQIGEAVGRSASQIFRTLAVLEQRGYLWKARPSGLYFLSMQLFEMAHRHPPTRGLVQVAIPVMRELAQAVRQSCNLGVYDFGRMIIVAEAESPAPFGFRVRVGGHFALLGAASGRALLAFQDETQRAEWLAVSDAAEMEAADRARLLGRLAEVRARGYEQTQDGLHAGVSDLAFPVLVDSRAIATLTVPYVSTSYSETPMDKVIAAVGEAAAAISVALRGA
ncbi:IclR family transcriptional regulator [Devosia lacusdianchii]|uniref:IclR family transcriptional regulator n=1 Tax=Devosia lacusdianchii TaxID=2917991 RepID=UPI001F057F99|nr:IclR family transcriptional regulator [Devosia sp. JXJ CY 41]